MRTPKNFRRKKHGQTDYYKRLKLVKSGVPRLVVRPSGKGMSAQIIEYERSGDRILKTVTDRSLKGKGYDFRGNSISISYLVGYTLAAECRDLGLEEVILDTGRRNMVRGGRISAVLMGFVEGGGHVPHDPSIFPTEERIMGHHLKNKSVGEKMAEIRKPKVEAKKPRKVKKDA